MSGGSFSYGPGAQIPQNPVAAGFNFGQSQTTPIANKGLLATPAMTSTPSGGGFSLGTLPTSAAPGGVITSVPSGYSFGTVPTTSAASGYSFGTVPTTSAPSGYSFGTVPTTSAPGGFSFGSTPTPALGAQLTTSAPAMGGFSFSSPQTTATSTTAATAGGFSFGTTPAAVTSSAAGFALGGGTAMPASTAGTGFSFGSNMGTTAGGTSGFSMGGLGGTTPALSSTGFSFANTSQPTTAKPSGFGFGTTPQSNVAPASSAGGLGGTGMGLGGAQPPSANASGANSTGAKADGKSAKEQQLPHDLFGTIAVFESWRNAENSASEENIRLTATPFHKVGKKAEEIQQLLAELASEYLQIHSNAVNLKAEVMKEAEHVEMARRTKDTPMALQGENKAPEVYFINLVRAFEAEMIYCRNKIDEVSMCMQAANNPCESPDDVGEVLQREHETLKEMASKVYSKHAQLVELSHRFNTKTVVNDQAFFRAQNKDDVKTPASAVVRPVLGGSSSGLQAFQEQQQRAKAVTLGAAPPTMPLAQTTTPSLFGSNTGSGLFTGSSSFGTNTFNMGSGGSSTLFNSKPLFGNTSTTGFGGNLSFGSNTSGIQQTSSPFSMNSPFNTKPFGS